MYTDKEKSLARSIVADKETLEFIEKMFCQAQKRWGIENLSLKNASLGEVVKADILAEKHVKDRFETLKRLGTVTSGKKSSVPA
jgi:hypothetical protein